MLQRVFKQLAAFGWGFVLALLLWSFCQPNGPKTPSQPVVRVETVRVKELVRDTVITVRERLLGWVKVEPETVILSPETVLVETIWAEKPWAVVWAKGEEGRLSVVALKEDSLGRALVRDYSFSVGNQWLLAAGDTGLALKTRWRVRVRPFVGFGAGWDGELKAWPLVGVRLDYKGWEGRVWVGRGVGVSVGRVF